MVAILMMSAKMATLGLLKIKIFRNKAYDVLISVYEVTNKILSHDSYYIAYVVISMREAAFYAFLVFLWEKLS